MKWLVWGERVVDGEKEPCILGELVCKAHAGVALVLARKRFGCKAVARVQSVLSHEVDLAEVSPKVFERHHPRPYHKRRKPEKLKP